jgi:hypothetical protein
MVKLKANIFLYIIPAPKDIDNAFAVSLFNEYDVMETVEPLISRVENK